MPIDVHVERAAIKRSSITFMSRLSMGLVRNDVRVRLAPWLDGFTFGKCFDFNGYLITTHSTFYSARVAHVRAQAGSTYRACATCGTIWEEEFVGDWYFTASDVGERSVFQDHICVTYVKPEVAAAAKLHEFRDIELTGRTVSFCFSSGIGLPSAPPDSPGERPGIFTHQFW